jgi:tetratricopeptide (TPR) repeat protein
MHRTTLCVLASLALGATGLHAQQSVDSTSLVAQAMALDLDGHYTDARAKLSQAINQAATDSAKARPRRTLAISYAFTCETRDVSRYERQVIDAAAAKQNFGDAADVSNELARMLLECGDINDALTTYRSGHDFALRQPNLTDSTKDLWDFRWEHAQARIAARRGQAADAKAHVAAAKAILDKGTNPDQRRFFPYLTGYVALYTGDPKSAITDLQQADQHDPFILALLAAAYERAGNPSAATPYYRQILDLKNHNPPMAYARPIARRKLATTKRRDP